MKLGEQMLENPKIVKEALELLRGFGFQVNVMDDNLFANARNLVRLNNELFYERQKVVKKVFVLMADLDGTMRSNDEPFGVAVKSEEEAKRFVEEGGVGYSHSYKKLVIFDNKDEAIRYCYPDYKK